MSSNTWTIAELVSSIHSLSGACWRVVETQYKNSTMKLTDTLDEQAIIEQEIEETKPPIPAECQHLDVLLYTPFRYRPYKFNSRFRRSGSLEGAFYASEHVETAVAEQAFRRLLFFADSPDTPFPENPTEYTAFKADFETNRAIDISAGALARPYFLDPIDYSECQRLAEAARAEGVDVIRSTSVRDPQGKANITILRCRAFSKPTTRTRQTWHLHLGFEGIRAYCEMPAASLMFNRDTFTDPRLDAFSWDRASP
ncbi:MAG: RES domain-containing protein [Alphaproteobacteria bacterium]|nr:RES domain-containing protein [Alphaproteobacteria bacterium]